MKAQLCEQPAAKPNPQQLYEGLKNTEPAAIRYLYAKILRHLQAKRCTASASVEDAEELANDAVLLALQKIGNGAYVFQGYSPLTFTLLIADNLLRNFCRKKNLDCQALGDFDSPIQADVEAYLQHKELEQSLQKALETLDETSRLVIRLKYFDDLRDEEIISRRLTPYTSVDSLKTKRCTCMKKLRSLLPAFLLE
jgi:DNA-directed RNA polymerase specialized sigma24 family protein